jgi:hypothetical protein
MGRYQISKPLVLATSAVLVARVKPQLLLRVTELAAGLVIKLSEMETIRY